jgi:hypothetical protein
MSQCGTKLKTSAMERKVNIIRKEESNLKTHVQIARR